MTSNAGMRSELTRRDAIGLFLGAGTALALNACSSSPTTEAATATGATSTALATAVPATGASAAAAPAVELEAEVRDLVLRLWAEPSTAEIMPGIVTDVYSFGAEVIEGDPGSVTPSSSYLGPTLHMRQGQRVRVTFENQIPDETIVHWHGLVVPQDQDGQPGETVGNGGTYEYDFEVTNAPGTYWYHPHPHGKTGEQVYQGMAGLLIVHGDEPSLPSGDNDMGLVLQDRTIGSDGQLRYTTTMHDQMAGFVGDMLVTNGVADFAVDVRREAYRVRLLNGGNSRTQYLTLSNGQPLTVLAVDGSLLPQAIEVEGLVLTPSQRTDLWLDFSGFEPGDELALLSADTFVEAGALMGAGMMGGSAQQAALDVDPRAAARFVVMDSPVVPGTVPELLGPPLLIGAADAVNVASPKEFVLSTRMASHWINNAQWEGREASEIETVKANTVELWEFVNLSPLAHPMHLHGNSFVVTGRSWESDAARDSWASIESGVIDQGMRDTVLVWPGQRVQIAVPFAEHLGYFMYHCHILEHEDHGMMRNFLVT